MCKFGNSVTFNVRYNKLQKEQCLIGFRSGLIEGHFTVVQCCQMSSAVCFGEPLKKYPDTGWHILLQNAIIILRFQCTPDTQKQP